MYEVSSLENKIVKMVVNSNKIWYNEIEQGGA